jgi:hypothetical protein
MSEKGPSTLRADPFNIIEDTPLDRFLTSLSMVPDGGVMDLVTHSNKESHPRVFRSSAQGIFAMGPKQTFGASILLISSKNGSAIKPAPVRQSARLGKPDDHRLPQTDFLKCFDDGSQLRSAAVDQ